MAADRPLRLGIVGCGRIVERGYVPAALATDGVRVAALADPSEERMQRCVELCAEAAGPAVFSGASELIESETVDAVVVAVPPAAHLEVAELAARAGLPCLVEKPPASELEEAIAMAALQPPPFFAFNRRFLQGVELRPTVPADGWLEMELKLRYRRAAWGAHEVRDDALLDAGVHLIDLACFLASSAAICVRRATVEPERAELELELGRGRARIRCATDRRHREQVAVRDGSGRLLASSKEGGVAGRFAALGGAPHPLVASLRLQLEALRRAIRGEAAASLATAQDGVAAMAAVDAARRSAELGGAEVTIAPVGVA